MKTIKESIIGRKGVTRQNKYQMTSETKTINGHKLHRIRALKDIPICDVLKGEYGGYIESSDNLDQNGNCWVSQHACVWENARVYENGYVGNHAMRFNNAQIYGDAEVFQKAKVYGNAKVYGRAAVCGDAEVFGSANVDYFIQMGKITK